MQISIRWGQCPISELTSFIQGQYQTIYPFPYCRSSQMSSSGPHRSLTPVLKSCVQSYSNFEDLPITSFGKSSKLMSIRSHEFRTGKNDVMQIIAVPPTWRGAKGATACFIDYEHKQYKKSCSRVSYKQQKNLARFALDINTWITVLVINT